jgi:hypothetical protein
MADTKIVVKDVQIHPETGYVTYHVYSDNSNGNIQWHGPVKQYGCDHQMLRDRFHGSLEEFEAYVANEHRPFSGADPSMTEAVLKRKGAVIG